MIRVFPVILFLISLGLIAQSTPLGQWNVYLPYSNGRCLAEADGEIMVGTVNSYLFSYDFEEESVNRYSNLDGFAHSNVAAIAYDAESDRTVVAYDNSDVDIISSNFLVNLPDIKDKNIVGAKNINSIRIVGDLAYLACGFGIVVIDMEREEVKDTYFIGPESTAIQVYEITDDGEDIYAATELGVFRASLDDPNLVNFANWYLFDATDGVPGTASYAIHNYAGDIYAGSEGTLMHLQGDTWESLHTVDSIYNVSAIGSRDGEIVLLSLPSDPDNNKTKLKSYDLASGQVFEFISQYLQRARDMIVTTEGEIFLASDWYGLVPVVEEFVKRGVEINGPASPDSHGLAIDGARLWVAPGTVTTSWSFQSNGNGIFSLDDDSWWNTYRPDVLKDNSIKDIVSVAVHPSQDRTFFASFGKGVLERNGSDWIHHLENSSLGPAIGNTSSTFVTDVLFDENENLWVCNYRATEPISVYTSDGVWQSLPSPFTASGDNPNSLTHIAQDVYGRFWIAVLNTGVLCYDPGEDILDAGDDQHRLFKKVNDDIGLPVSGATCIAEDLEEEIWVGTKEGIGIFYQSFDPFNNQYQFSKPIVASGTFPYLMQSEYVHTIAVDPADRKWIGTNNGVFLVSPDGRETVHHFTTENSPLLNNSINDILVNEKTGVVYFATEAGLCSYQSDALFGEYFHDGVVAYPNPVRPEYDGPIAIKGLYRNANVKITDLRGRLVYETEALGGQATWDGKTYDGERPHTGVYLVFSTSEDGLESFVTKLLFIK